MKQCIYEEQYNELSLKQKKAWEKLMVKYGHTMKENYGWWLEKNYDPKMLVSFPSIGQMIEFLDDNGDKWDLGAIMTIGIKISSDPNEIGNESIDYGSIEVGGLCDALWEAVKDILKEK